MKTGSTAPIDALNAIMASLPFHGLGVVVVFAGIAYLLWSRWVLLRKTRQFERISRRYASTIDVSLDAIVVADGNGRILDFNLAAERLFGYSKNAAIGAEMAELIVPAHYREAHRAGLRRWIATREPRVVNRGRVKLEGLRSNGETFPIELSLGVTDSPEGPIFTGYIRDISEQLKAQREITQARDEALAAASAKSQFLAVMSHEMRTPLNGVLAVLDILLSGHLDEKQRRFAEAAINSGELLQRHIDDLLQLNELENRRMTFHRSTFSIGDMLRDVIAMNAATAAAKSNKLFLQTDIGDTFIIEDRHRISQVLVNLLSNAVKFTDNGRIEVSAERIAGPNGADLIEFAVHDNGAGIPLEDQERIFETFVTLDPNFRATTRGYGLGLAISRRVVRAMGGDIGVESRPGHYSHFWVRLPFREASASATAKAFKSSSARPFELPNGPVGLRVLIVEDDETNRLVAAEMLTKFGCSVAEAVDGIDGLAKAGVEKFDLILMDVNMPNLGGLEATRRLREATGTINQKTPIVGMTAHALPEEQERLLQGGMQECLIKPVRARNIQALLRSFMEFPAEFASKDAETDPETAGIPQLDDAVIMELKDLLPGPAFGKRVEAFLGELAGLDATLAAAQASGDITAVERAAHKAAGAAAVFGAIRLRGRLVAIEQAAKGARPDEVERLLAGVGDLATAAGKAFAPHLNIKP